MRCYQIQIPLARARGLGSARSGASQWWAQRVTAIALVPLTIWFVVSIVPLMAAGHQAFLDWRGSRINVVLLTLFVPMLFYHMALGLQVIAEDYLRRESTKITAKISIQLACLTLTIASIVAILR
ncbi:succinate dehydrogenase, hydrophobic membrane anchor protein [Microbaculum marinum]|uniref:Succinate dehydrogenase hydrophobic membrane anchor subunit n=1 Tax=Microbaculum marinum TaxID=1764581 RepID=A0AAW9RNE1_9HYPH